MTKRLAWGCVSTLGWLLACSSAGDPLFEPGGGSVGVGGSGEPSSGLGGSTTTTSPGSESASDRDNEGGSGGAATGAVGGSGEDGDQGGTAGTPRPVDAGGVTGPVTTPPDAAGRDSVIGWASVPGDGVATTTGGIEGTTVTPSTAEELVELATRSEPLVIIIDRAFTVPRLQVTSNKTLMGTGPGALIAGGIRIRGSEGAPVSNVVVKNLQVDGATSDVDGDAVQIYYAHHVWIDHCEIQDAPDGNLDIVHAANWVTVSWTKFRYSANAPDPTHRFSNLVGHSDSNGDEDTGRLKVTFHHDWWAEGVVERMPRVRFGDVHVFNSYFSSQGNNYAVGAAYAARVLLENNFFDRVNDPHIFYDGEPTAELVASGNVYEQTTGAQESGQGPAFDPPYPYSLDPAETIRDVVAREAGPR